MIMDTNRQIREKQPNKKTFIVILILFGFLIIQCKKNEFIETDQSDVFCLNENLRENISLDTLQLQDVAEQVILTGKIEYDKNDLVSLASLMEGSVEKVYFEQGDFVKKGQVLATIRSENVQNRIEEKELLQNQVVILSEQVSIKKKLLEDGLSSVPEVLELESEWSKAKISLQKMEQTLALYHIDIEHKSYQIVAPKDGHIVQKKN